jgi:hypothetical protein
VIIKCESFVRPRDSDAVDTCFQTYRSTLTLHEHSLGMAVVPNRIIASAHRDETDDHELYHVVFKFRPSSAQRLHQRELFFFPLVFRYV